MTTTTPKYALKIQTTPGTFVDYTGFAYLVKHAGTPTDANLAKHMAFQFEEDLAIIESAQIIRQSDGAVMATYAA